MTTATLSYTQLEALRWLVCAGKATERVWGRHTSGNTRTFDALERAGLVAWRADRLAARGQRLQLQRVYVPTPAGRERALAGSTVCRRHPHDRAGCPVHGARP